MRMEKALEAKEFHILTLQYPNTHVLHYLVKQGQRPATLFPMKVHVGPSIIVTRDASKFIIACL